MCHQTVGLVQAELERQGIVTTGVTLLPEISTILRIPRALSVPFPLGYPLGKAHDADLQRQILEAALGLVTLDALPLLREWPTDT